MPLIQHRLETLRVCEFEKCVKRPLRRDLSPDDISLVQLGLLSLRIARNGETMKCRRAFCPNFKQKNAAGVTEPVSPAAFETKVGTSSACAGESSLLEPLA